MSTPVAPLHPEQFGAISPTSTLRDSSLNFTIDGTFLTRTVQQIQRNSCNGGRPMDRMLILHKKDSGKCILLEWNRRLAALKILSNPNVLTSLHVKPSLQKRFEALSNIHPKRNRTHCWLRGRRPRRGNRWILPRHTGENEDGGGLVLACSFPF